MRCTIILISGFLSSCVNLKPIQQNNNQPIHNLEELQVINGDYYLNNTDDSYGDLDQAFEFENEINYRTDSTHVMRLTVLTKKSIKAELFRGDTLIEEKILKGKLRNNYFILNMALKIPVFYILLNGFRSRKTRFGILSNGNLTLDTKHGGCAMLVIFPLFCAGDQAYQKEYLKIK